MRGLICFVDGGRLAAMGPAFPKVGWPKPPAEENFGIVTAGPLGADTRGAATFFAVTAGILIGFSA